MQQATTTDDLSTSASHLPRSKRQEKLATYTAKSLADLIREHRDLDTEIRSLSHNPGECSVRIANLKLRKLKLKRQIAAADLTLAESVVNMPVRLTPKVIAGGLN